MLKFDLSGLWSFVSERKCKHDVNESMLQKFLCWLFGCCPEDVK